MKEIIELNQEIELNKILLQINGGSSCFWKVLWISGFGKTKDDITIMTLEDQINKSEEGILYSWKSLFDFTTGTLQLHEFLLLGDINLEKLHRYEDDEIMKKSCEFCIELVDSSYWEISSSNSFFLENIKDNLK